jgi:hypothetical protein
MSLITLMQQRQISVLSELSVVRWRVFGAGAQKRLHGVNAQEVGDSGTFA